MLGVSQEFLRWVRTDHTVVSRCDVIQNGKVVKVLDIHDGTVTVDRTAAIQRTCTVSLSDPDGDLTPVDIQSLLAPFGTRIQLWRGVRKPAVTSLQDLDNNTLGTFSTGNHAGTRADPGSGFLTLAF